MANINEGESKCGQGLRATAVQFADRVKSSYAEQQPKWTGLGMVLEGVRVSMDCLCCLDVLDEDVDAVAVFHASNRGDERGGEKRFSALILVDLVLQGTAPPAFTNPRRLSDRGSQGHLFRTPGSSASDPVYLAYELESNDGNMIAVRRYDDQAALRRGGQFSEWQLERHVRLGTHGNSLDKTASAVKNMGTPTIDSIVDGKAVIQFHFARDGYDDIPGQGELTLKGTGVRERHEWDTAVFNTQVNNQLRIAKAVGKIGQRTTIASTHAHVHMTLFEAQTSNAADTESPERVASWRIFAYDGETAVMVPLILDGCLIFANPRAAVVRGKLLVSFFVHEPSDRPSEGSGTFPAGSCMLAL